MKSLLSIILLSLSLSAFALPEDYFMNPHIPQKETEEVEEKSVVIIVDNLDLADSKENAIQVCQDEGFETAVEYTASVETSTLLNVVCK